MRKPKVLLCLGLSQRSSDRLDALAKAANMDLEEYVQILIDHEWVRMARFEDGGGRVGEGVRLTPKGTPTRQGMLTVKKKRSP